MRICRLFSIISVALTSVYGLAEPSAQDPAPPKPPSAEVQKIIEGNTAFAFDLYGRLRGEAGNVFFSPVSISTALGMTYAGARGQTADEMARVLHFELPPDRLHSAFGQFQRFIRPPAGSKAQLHIANALWPDQKYPFLPEFFSLVQAKYDAAAQAVDFAGATEQARKTINTWVAEKTAHKITELLKRGDIDGMTALVLTNAVYFKADWARQFDAKDTQEGEFRVANAQNVRVPFMKQRADFNYVEHDGVQLLELPYACGGLSMLVLLPTRPDGLAALEGRITAAWLRTAVTGLSVQKINVTLPRFKTKFRVYLGETLAAMGMPRAFSRAADFSGMDGSRELFISKVIHEAYIDLNEEGTEAAAATGVVMSRSAARPTVDFTADHPFMLVIREEVGGTILFMGRIRNPVE